MANLTGWQKMLIFCINTLMLISLNLSAQEKVRPIKNDFLLSGNFGELRASHFHAGIDIRTGGAEGLPVICVMDGVLSRVSVSPTGYGLALYIEHPDGTTTVYGHLQRCVPSVEALIRKLQYQKESFRIDEKVGAYQITFKKGDVIAYSGNSGSSGGPHLHFEVRNTATERTLNPLNYYSIRDQKAPTLRKLYLYSIADNGCVNRLGGYALKTVKNGEYHAGVITVPAGNLGVGVHLVDYMNDSWNKLGVYRMRMVVEQDTLFDLQMDSCSFNQGRLVNDLKDFFYYKKKETVYRCFGNYQDQILGLSNQRKGYISIEEDSVVNVKLHFADKNGNQSRLYFKLKGKRNTQVFPEYILHYSKPHILRLPGCCVALEAGSLFTSIEKKLEVEQDSVTGQNVFLLSAEEVPLLKKAHIQFSGSFSSQSLICELDQRGRKWPVETTWSPAGVEAHIGFLNRYMVVEDTVAPQITYLGKVANKVLRFRIKDDFSGIANYRGEVNGKWTLFSYDAKNNLLQCNLSEPAFVKQSTNVVKIRVEDKVGNVQELVIKVAR